MDSNILSPIKSKYRALYKRIFSASRKKESYKELLDLHFNSLAALKNISGQLHHDFLEIVDYQSVYSPEFIAHPDCQYFGELLKNFGSDKSTQHKYYISYFAFLNPRRYEPLNVFEIGLGTNNLKYRANMGVDGKPGASIRAFKEFLPNANIYGADIDKEILFQEERIKTFFIDQLDLSVLEEVKKNLADTKFDLIIDDGLHNPDANLNVVNFALDLLADDGILVVEDIKERFYPYFQMLYQIIKGQYEMQHIKSGRLSLVIIKKRK